MTNSPNQTENKGGNPGYGKMEIVRQNFDKFSPKFWELMSIYADSRNPDFEKIFITEFNKIQVKMIPQTLAGDKENPVVFMPAEIIEKFKLNAVPPSAEPSSEGQS